MDNQILLAIIAFAFGWMSYKMKISIMQWRVARYAKKRGVLFIANAHQDVQTMYDHIDFIAEQNETLEQILGVLSDEHDATDGNTDSDSADSHIH